MARLSDRSGCVALIVFFVVPGLIVAYLLHSALWLIAWPLILVVLICVVASLPIKRKITPQEWANDLEKHLLKNEGPYDWDDATSITLADQRLESLRYRLVKDFDLLDTPEKREEFRQIIEALRRGEVP